MLSWLRSLFHNKTGSANGPSDLQPLSFSYRAKDRAESRVHLRNWSADSEYVVGTSLTHDRQLTYRLDRITRFHDQSYRQLKNYRPPVGSPLHSGRLP